MTPRSSIIIRAHNSSKTIERALESAMNQAVAADSYEIIIVDDGSTDSTGLLVSRWLNDRRVRSLRTPHQGPASAANLGLFLARGEYVVFLDADDRFEPGLLAVLADHLDQHPTVDYVYPDYWETSGEERKRVSPADPFQTILVGTMFRRKKLEAVGNLRDDVAFSEYELFLRTYDDWTSDHVPEPLFEYFRSATSMTGNPRRVSAWLGQLEQLHPSRKHLIAKIRSYQL